MSKPPVQMLKLMGDFLSLATWALSPAELAAFKAIRRLIVAVEKWKKIANYALLPGRVTHVGTLLDEELIELACKVRDFGLEIEGEGKEGG